MSFSHSKNRHVLVCAIFGIQRIDRAKARMLLRRGFTILLILIVFRGTARSDVVVLHPLSWDESFRDPAAFQTDDLAGRGVSSSDPTIFINRIALGDLPPQFSSTMTSDMLVSTSSTPILDFEITAGRRARFGGGALLWNTTGDMNPLVSGRDLTRLSDSSVYLRFWTKGDSFIASGSPVLNSFESRFEGTDGFGSGDIQAIPELSSLRLMSDVPLNLAPQQFQVLGKVTLTASGRSPNPSSGTWKSDAYAALVVKNPTLDSLDTPLLQGSTPWKGSRYAPTNYDAFVDGLSLADPLRERLSRPKVKELYTIGARGCAVTSLAMALDALDRPALNPQQVHDILDESGGFRPAGKVTGFSKSGRPYFSGNDLDWSVAQDKFNVSIVLTEKIDEIAAALGRGMPVIVRVPTGKGPSGTGVHFELVTGIRSIDGGPVEIQFQNPAPGTGIDTGWSPWLSTYSARIVSDDASITTGRLTYESPLEVTLTAPDGRVITFDSLNGITNTDFVDAVFETRFPIISPEDLEDDEFPSLDLGDLPGELYMPQLTDGTYTVSVRGTGDGPFSIFFDASDGRTGSRRLLTQSGNISLGEIRTFEFQFAAVPEPSPFALGVLGSVLFLLARVRRRPS